MSSDETFGAGAGAAAAEEPFLPNEPEWLRKFLGNDSAEAAWRASFDGRQVCCANGVTIVLDGKPDRLTGRRRRAADDLVDCVFSPRRGRVVGRFDARGRTWTLYNNGAGVPLAIVPNECFILDAWERVLTRGPELIDGGFFDDQPSVFPRASMLECGQYKMLSDLLADYETLVAEKYAPVAQHYLVPSNVGFKFQAGGEWIVVMPSYRPWCDNMYDPTPFSIELTVLGPHNPAMRYGFTLGFCHRGPEKRLVGLAVNGRGSVLVYTPHNVRIIARNFAEFKINGPNGRCALDAKRPRRSRPKAAPATKTAAASLATVKRETSSSPAPAPAPEPATPVKEEPMEVSIDGGDHDGAADDDDDEEGDEWEGSTPTN